MNPVDVIDDDDKPVALRRLHSWRIRKRLLIPGRRTGSYDM